MKPIVCAAQSTNLSSVIPGRHRLVASPESITTSLGVWIPGSRKSAPRNDAAYDSKFKNVELTCLLAQQDSAGDADAQYVEPALREIEKVGIKQRTDEILRDDAGADPGCMPGHDKHPKVRGPHCEQQHNTDKPERNSDCEDLVVRVGCRTGRTRVPPGILRKHGLGRAGAVTNKRRFTNNFQRHFPELNAGSG